MDSVFLVWYDNGEDYEDHYTCVEKVFHTRKNAERYLEEDLDFERVDHEYGPTWIPKKDACPFGLTEGENCARQFCPMFSPSENDDVLTGVRECKHEDLFWENKYLRHFYTIEQREVY